jgi:hypothetical protein
MTSKTSRISWIALVAGLGVAAACSSGGSGGSGGVGGTGATGGGGQGGIGGSAGSTGGSAGSAGSAGSGGSAGSAGSAGSSGAAGSAGSGGGTAGDHIVISEVGTLPSGAEFVEIYNPTSTAVGLEDYYIADNSAYHTLTSGPWNPQGTPNTDFLAQFPAGTTIAADGVLVVALNSGYETAFGGCPDFFMNATAAPVSCGGANVPAMQIPANGSVGTSDGQLVSNDREMIVLFSWDGAAATIEDIDYVTWGTTFDDNTRVDKTGVSGYQPDTPRASQAAADPGLVDGGAGNLSIERCSLEDGETLSGGNGSTGHDETSEDFATSFSSQSTPSPGQKNACL